MIRLLTIAALTLTLAACDNTPQTPEERASSDALGMAVLGFGSGWSQARGVQCWNYGVMVQCR